MPKKVTITPEVHAVLARATVVGTTERPVVQLPPGQLARELYVATDKVLKALGGKWNRGANGHVFDRPVEGELAEALNNGVAVDAKRTAEQFFTPLLVAERVWDRAQLLPEHSVLEPSAGSGNLLNAPLRLGCRITCVEQDARLADLLRPLNVEVVCADFLSLEWATPRFDRVIMNPPFGRGADIAHVTRALQLLLPGGRLVAIMSPHWRFADDAKSKGFRLIANEHAYLWEPLPAATFRESGTDVNTGILTLTKGDNQL
jgi:predicted RNA methylase